MDIISNEDIQILNEAIKSANTFCIITHRHPDLDAICSCLAVYRYLSFIGKEANYIEIIINKYNSKFNFIKVIDLIKSTPSLLKYDLAIILDCSSREILDTNKVLNISEKILCIDHHYTTTNFQTDYSLLLSNVPSCTYILYKIFSP